MSTIGIDYSMSTPAMCLMGESTAFNDCKFYYLTGVKKAEGIFYRGNIIGTLHKEYYSEQERFDDISDFFLTKIPITKPAPSIAIEDYSFGSTGRIFNIAENTGLLKHKLWEVGYKFSVVAPTTIKKYASGKGNADKVKMYETFVKETGIELSKIMFPDRALGSPVSDIVDSYYIAKFIRTNS